MTDCYFQPNPSDVISVKTGNGNTYNFNVATVLAYASANNLGNSFVFFGSYSNVASIYFFNSSQTVGHFGTPSYIRYSTEYADYYWGFEQNLGFTPGSRRSYEYNMSNGTISSSSSISLTFNSKTVDDLTYYVSKPNWEYQNPSIIIYVGSLQTVVIDNVVPDMNQSGGAGSGYIGNPLLSNKKMVGYNVPTSSAESTKTESVSEASENPVSGKPKIGNGFARIKLITVADLLNIKSHSNPFSKLPSDNSETDITDLSGSEITNLFTNTDILVGQKNAKTFDYDEIENALVFDAGNANYTTSKYYIYLGGLYRFLRATFKYKKPIVYDLNVQNMTYMDVAKNIIASGNVVKENTNMFFNSDNQVGQGIINDYVSVTRDYSNDSRYITNYRNYIDIVAFNGKVYIKDLVIEAIKIE